MLALRVRLPGARLVFRVNQRTGGVRAAHIHAVPTENRNRRSKAGVGGPSPNTAKAEEKKYPRPTTVQPASTSIHTIACLPGTSGTQRDPTTRADGGTGMAPQRFR